MKKVILSATLALLFFNTSKACADYYADGDYFNLFTQSIIRDKAYIPFLHTYSSRFFEGQKVKVIDDNIELWRKYFGNRFNYDETEYLVNHMNIQDLNQYKNGNTGNALLSRLGSYGNFREGIDYLIEAKYLEPFMRINYVESPDTFYYRENENPQNATLLNYDRTVSALASLYNETKSPEIKARYGYQLVRFNHYTRNYQKAIDAFNKYVEPLKIRTSPYYLALDHLAGAQRGLQQNQDANWNFFQVFMHSNTRKESAFVSMKLSDSASFNNILKRAQTPEEKNTAYFLLGFDDFTNPIPMMEKMYEEHPDSEILKVMAARSINELERNFLPTYYSTDYEQEQNERLFSSNNDKKDVNKDAGTSKTKNVEAEQKVSFWDKVINFFKNIFGKSDSETNSKATSEEKRNESQSDDDLIENPNRLPVFTKTSNWMAANNNIDFSDDLAHFIEKAKGKSADEFWQIADAYMKFLKKNYDSSNEILAGIKTGNPEYIEQIKRLQMLNEITAQPRIDAAFEDKLMQKYPNLFAEKPKADSADYYYDYTPSTADFLRDILANRYFLQGEDGKSYLMNNRLSDLQYNPNSTLVKEVQEFYQKPNKTKFEAEVIGKNLDYVGDANDFFNLIYGDDQMRNANFEKAGEYYSQIKDFKGIPRFNEWDEATQTTKPKVYAQGEYDGFNGISRLIFGHNVWESFQSPENQSMVADFADEFSFIKNRMNKLELTKAFIQLKKIGGGRDASASKANQLIGNLLYNTSSLGYFRHIFVMDIDNSNGGKYDFWTTDQEMPYQYYYKNFTNQTFIKPDYFDKSISYYQKALAQTADREQKARILFQMASAEQGKYYQWEAKQHNDVSYDDPQWEEKTQNFQTMLDKNRNDRFRNYFAQLKSQFGDTQTAQQLQGSCSYFAYFMRRN